MCSKCSCLGEPWCSEWDCCLSDSELEDFEDHPRKKAKLDSTSTKRFVSPTSEVDMKKSAKASFPKIHRRLPIGRFEYSRNGELKGTKHQVSSVLRTYWSGWSIQR